MPNPPDPHDATHTYSPQTPSEQDRAEWVAGLCADQANRWRRGDRVLVEAYLEQHPALREDPEALLDLIQGELLLRREAGEAPTLEEYRRRFPGQAELLRDLLLLHRALGGTGDLSTPVDAQTPVTKLPATPGPVPAGAEVGIPDPGGRTSSFVPGGSPAATSAPPRLLGEYELGERLGGGGMGVVYRARHRRLGKDVALKLLAAKSRSEPDLLSRFLREMKALGGMKHPNVVEAYDAGESQGLVYLSMELVEGTDLHRLVQERGPLPVAEACDLLRHAAVGLAYLHGRGLVHRDLKPSNLMRTTDGVVKVLDLGLARWRAGEDGSLTLSGVAMGTPDYQAPEQVANAAAADVHADVYGLGCTLFYLLTGKAPFAHRSSLSGKMAAHRSEDPPDVRALRPEVPGELAELVRRLLAKDPADRPASAAAVAAALVAFTATNPPPTPLNTGTGRPGSRRRRAWAVAAGLLLAGLLGLGTWYLRGRDGKEPSDVSPPPNDPAPAVAGTQRKPLTVRLRVLRFSPEGDENQLAGEVGKETYRARFDDRVEVEADLSEPAYAYLIAFNPTDKPGEGEQLIPRREAGQAPPRRDHLATTGFLRLNDGAGLQAFAVVASRQPLPPYAEWRTRRPPLDWGRKRATKGVVRQSDGEKPVRSFFDPGAFRAEEEENDKEVIDKLARALRGLPGVEAVAVVGFAVEKLE